MGDHELSRGAAKLIDRQQNAHDELKRILSNAKKLGAAQRTPKNYQSLMLKAKKVFDELEVTHEELSLLNPPKKYDEKFNAAVQAYVEIKDLVIVAAPEVFSEIFPDESLTVSDSTLQPNAESEPSTSAQGGAADDQAAFASHPKLQRTPKVANVPQNSSGDELIDEPIDLNEDSENEEEQHRGNSTHAVEVNMTDNVEAPERSGNSTPHMQSGGGGEDGRENAAGGSHDIRVERPAATLPDYLTELKRREREINILRAQLQQAKIEENYRRIKPREANRTNERRRENDHPREAEHFNEGQPVQMRSGDWNDMMDDNQQENPVSPFQNNNFSFDRRDDLQDADNGAETPRRLSMRRRDGIENVRYQNSRPFDQRQYASDFNRASGNMSVGNPRSSSHPNAYDNNGSLSPPPAPLNHSRRERHPNQNAAPGQQGRGAEVGPQGYGPTNNEPAARDQQRYVRAPHLQPRNGNGQNYRENSNFPPVSHEGHSQVPASLNQSAPTHTAPLHHPGGLASCSQGSPLESATSALLGFMEKQNQLMEKLSETRSGGSNSIRPPTVDVQNFDNNVLSYRSFKAGFEAMVKRFNWNSQDALLHLRKKLQGNASTAISSVGTSDFPSDGDYELAWKHLDALFDDPRALIENSLNSLGPRRDEKTGSVSLLKRTNPEGVLQLSFKVSAAKQNLAQIGATLDSLIVYLAMTGLEPEIKTKLPEFLGTTRRLPTCDEFCAFLQRQSTIYQQFYGSSARAQRQNNQPPERQQGQNRGQQGQGEQAGRSRNGRRNSSNVFVTSSDAAAEGSGATAAPPGPRRQKCHLCRSEHNNFACPVFLAAVDKVQLMIALRLCMYCGMHKHSQKKDCGKRPHLKCATCGEQHATELHPLRKPATKVNLTQNEEYEAMRELYDSEDEDEIQVVNVHLVQKECTFPTGVILPTAVVRIQAENGQTVPVRCLLDQGSQSCFINEELVQTLGLKKKRTSVSLSGVSNIKSNANSLVTFRMLLDDPEIPEIIVKALVLKHVTNESPASKKVLPWLKDNKLKLADPHFNHPAGVPLLLGMDVLHRLFLNGVEKRDDLLLQNTRLGWIISGPTGETAPRQVKIHLTQLDDSFAAEELEVADPIQELGLLEQVEAKLLDFWDLPVTREGVLVIDNPDYCETLFQKTTTRDKEGRYRVSIPWIEDGAKLGRSYDTALKFYLGQEWRWNKNPELLEMSNKFMQEYLDLGHMREVPEVEQKDESGWSYYLKYISVVRKDALTTKLRNVFAANAPTDNGVALNSIIHAGPKLQTTIFDIITALRQFRFVFGADIKMMFRQFLLPEADGKRLRLFWRRSRNEPLKEYYMTTLVYGLVCSPWQAIRALRQVADDNAPSEEVREVVYKSFYMDDCLQGAHSIEDCQRLVAGLTQTLEAGKLPLTKWHANDPAILEGISDARKVDAFIEVDNQPEALKTLGLWFNPRTDEFAFKIRDVSTVTYTKRGLLSMTASIYDPINWLLPVIMELRILLQSLWAKKYNWDDKIDEESRKAFEKCILQLPCLAQVRIPRFTGGNETLTTEFVGFCDASGDGYGAVIYARVFAPDGIKVTLIAAKGRVVPLKTKANLESKLTTIPKMELESILVLTELYSAVVKNIKASSFRAYSDSEIAIAWVRNGENNENKVVKRRVNKIRKILKPSDLHHVRSAENPADAISRGQCPELFLNNQLWLQGPPWMLEESLPSTPFSSRVDCMITRRVKLTPFWERKEFSFSQAQRIAAMVLRFKPNAIRSVPATSGAGREGSGRKIKDLDAEEMTRAMTGMIFLQQKISFEDEIESLKKGKPLPKRHWLSTLSPYIDPTDGLLRVGGRLDHAKVPYANKHPILMRKCVLVDMYIKQVHVELEHGGKGLVERTIAEVFWIPALGTRVAKIVRSCHTCLRWIAAKIQPRMGPLPAIRVTASVPFLHVGVDYAGPWMIRASQLRFDKKMKVWAALFICMSTKTVQIELCLDLSSEAFLDAFSRLCALRGVPTHVYSDQATCFHGANNLQAKIWANVKTELAKKLALQHIRWEFSPVYTPTWGGLWERAIGTFKGFLKKTTEINKLSYAELSTTCYRIAAVMNSRPMYPSPTNPDDEPALTPNHLSLLRPYKMSPFDVCELPNLPASRRSRNLRDLQQHYWRRFQTEYLRHLQKRYKWKHPTRALQVGDLVLMEDHLAPPTAWKMARVVNTYPSKQNEVRIVDVRTAKAEIIQRAATRLVPLLIDDGDVDMLPPRPAATVQEALAELPEEEAQDELEEAVVTPNQEIEDGESDKQTADSAAAEPTVPVGNDNKALGIPGDVKDEPQPRRSARIRARQRNLLVTALLCWLSVVKAVDTSSVFPLEPGIHLLKTQLVSVSETDLSFSVRSGLNVTREISKINETMTEFNGVCEEMTTLDIQIATYCKKLAETLGLEVRSMSNRLTEVAREKRNVLAAVARSAGTALAKAAGKNAGSLTVAGYIFYQDYQIDNLNHKVGEINLKMNKLANIVANVTETEAQHVEEGLNTILALQRRQHLQGRVTAFGDLIQSQILSVEMKLRELASSRPIEELRHHVASHAEELGTLALPNLTHNLDLFTINTPTISIKKDYFTVTFLIPLVDARSYQEYVVISVPDENGVAITLSERAWVTRICVDSRNESVFWPANSTKLTDSIFRDVVPRAPSPCIAGILTWPAGKDAASNCEVEKTKRSLDWISAGPEWVVMATDDREKVTVKCGEKAEVLAAEITTVISRKSCEISAADIVIRQSMNGEAAVGDGETQNNATVSIPTWQIGDFGMQAPNQDAKVVEAMGCLEKGRRRRRA